MRPKCVNPAGVGATPTPRDAIITEQADRMSRMVRQLLTVSRIESRPAAAARPTDEGSGLGLYVSRELCRAMHGDLVLEPGEAGRGAAFTVTLPAEAPDES